MNLSVEGGRKIRYNIRAVSLKMKWGNKYGKEIKASNR